MARRRRHPARSVATRAFQILCCSLISGWVGLLKMLHSSGMHWHAATRRFGSRCPSPAGSGPSGESCCLHSVTPPAPAAANLKSESLRRIQYAGARPRRRDYDASPIRPGDMLGDTDGPFAVWLTSPTHAYSATISLVGHGAAWLLLRLVAGPFRFFSPAAELRRTRPCPNLCQLPPAFAVVFFLFFLGLQCHWRRGPRPSPVRPPCAGWSQHGATAPAGV